MSDSEVNLERLRDGLRNWRLINPNYKGPGKYLVLSLTAERSVINVKNHALNFNLAINITPNPAYSQSLVNTSKSEYSKPQALAVNRLPNKIIFSGDYLKAPLNGILFADSTMTFQRTKKLFHANGFVEQGKNKIQVSGQLGDVIKKPLIDADIEFSGDIFSIVNLIKSAELAGKQTFNFSTHLFKRENQYEFRHFAGEINGSDIKGDLSYFYDSKTPSLSGKLLSESIDFKDFINLFARLKKANSGSYSSFSFVENLKRSDTDLNLNIQKVKNIQPAELGPLTLTVNGQAGKFDVNIKEARLNGGKLSGSANLNFDEELSKTGVAKFDAQIAVNQLQIAKLVDSTNLDEKLSAPMAVKANLHSAGDSFARITKNLSGTADVTIGKGIISNKLDAKLGLDFGKIFWLSLRGDKNITLNCGKLGFDIKQGVATSNTFWVNTAQTIVEGKGSIDLNNQHINVLIDPQPKDPSLFSTSKSIQLSGQLGAGDFAIKTTDSKLKKSAKNASSHQC